jgi:hypothetical protein
MRLDQTVLDRHIRSELKHKICYTSLQMIVAIDNFIKFPQKK